MARCLVTGHKGYIGSEVYKQLKDLGHEVMGIDLVDGHDILECLKPGTNGNFLTIFPPSFMYGNE